MTSIVSAMILSMLLGNPEVNQSYTWGETTIVISDDLTVSPEFAKDRGLTGTEKTVYFTVVITERFPLLRHATGEEIKRLQKRGFPAWK